MSNLHPKQTNHRILSGGCNEPCTVRVTQQLRGNVSGQKRLNSVGFESGVSNPALLHSEKLRRFHDGTRGMILQTLCDDEKLSEVEHVMRSHHTMKVRAVLGAGRKGRQGGANPEIGTCVGTPMVGGIGLSMNQTLDTLS